MSTNKKNNDTSVDSIMNNEDYSLLQGYKTAWQKASDAGDEMGMSAAHSGAEQLRAKYGYSAGESGSEYIKLADADMYSGGLNTSLDALSKRESFSYDPEDDPLYSDYRKQYLREGQRATEDTLGNYATMTGGLPSTAAVNAASQAGDYYNTQLTDVIPELQQLAYSMYMDEGDALRSDISMYQGLESNAINNERYDQQWSYNVAQDEYEKALAVQQSAQNMIYNIISQGNTPSAALIEAAGWTTEDVYQLMQK